MSSSRVTLRFDQLVTGFPCLDRCHVLNDWLNDDGAWILREDLSKFTETDWTTCDCDARDVNFIKKFQQLWLSNPEARHEMIISESTYVFDEGGETDPPIGRSTQPVTQTEEKNGLATLLDTSLQRPLTEAEQERVSTLLTEKLNDDRVGEAETAVEGTAVYSNSSDMSYRSQVFHLTLKPSVVPTSRDEVRVGQALRVFDPYLRCWAFVCVREVKADRFVVSRWGARGDSRKTYELMKASEAWSIGATLYDDYESVMALYNTGSQTRLVAWQNLVYVEGERDFHAQRTFHQFQMIRVDLKILEKWVTLSPWREVEKMPAPVEVTFPTVDRIDLKLTQFAGQFTSSGWRPAKILSADREKVVLMYEAMVASAGTTTVWSMRLTRTYEELTRWAAPYGSHTFDGTGVPKLGAVVYHEGVEHMVVDRKIGKMLQTVQLLKVRHHTEKCSEPFWAPVAGLEPVPDFPIEKGPAIRSA